ncbi:MAG: phosphoglycerate dehydrogenase [Gemmataceae bacterium]|nr:phosphoglycerate dehydrogenase [Gemmataceae bacterium]
MPKVLIVPVTLAGVGGPYVKVLQDAGFELVYATQGRQLTEDELLAYLPGINASIAGSEPYTRRVLQTHPQLRVIARSGVGFDAVDLEAACDCNVAVTITPNTNQDAVAEHTFLLMLALAKNLIPQHQGTVAGGWPRQANLPLRGRVLGIGGLGRIGKATAIRGACFGMKLLAYEPFPDHAFAKQYGITYVSWEELLRQSDYLSLHMPANKESRHIINKKALALMKPSAFLVNTARGSLVNEPDLVDALRAGTIAGAGIDVFEREPPGNHPLFHMSNVVITPHSAGVDLQSRDDMALSAATAIVSLMKGEWPAEKVVNAQIKDKFRW